MSDRIENLEQIAIKAGLTPSVFGVSSLAWMDLLRSMSEVASVILPIMSVAFIALQIWAVRRREAREARVMLARIEEIQRKGGEVEAGQ